MDTNVEGDKFSAADVSDLRAMRHTLVYLLVTGKGGDCSAFEVTAQRPGLAGVKQ